MQKKNYVQEILDIIHSGLPQAELAEKGQSFRFRSTSE